MKKLIIYNSYFSSIGGIETFIYNFCYHLHNDYDITVIVNRIPDDWVDRLSSLVKVVTDPQEEYKCDTLLMTRVIDPIPTYIKYKKVIRRIHTCKFYDLQSVPEDGDIDVCVSQAVKDSFELKDGVVIHNLANVTAKKTLLLMSCTRIPAPDKGENVERMRILGKMLDAAEIPYIWLNFSDNDMEDAPKHFHNMGHRADIQNVMQKADYIVQLSTIEACSNTVLEALTLNVPLICTPVPSFFELGVVDKVNAHIVPFDMDFDIHDLLDIPKFYYIYDNAEKINKWKEIL